MTRLANILSWQDRAGLHVYLNDLFWGRESVAPDARHLAIALKNRDVESMRVLVQWGARFSAQELADLAIDNEDVETCYALLRRAGHEVAKKLPAPNVARTAVYTDFPLMPFGKARQSSPLLSSGGWTGSVYTAANPALIACVEKELTFLKAVCGHLDDQAIIAGGFLRDTLQGRAVRDVDIFLHHDGIMHPRRNTELKNVMAGCVAHSDFFIDDRGAQWGRTKPFDIKMDIGGVKKDIRAHGLILVVEGVRFNLTFLDLPKTENPALESYFAHQVVGSFDFGLCGIALSADNMVFVTGACVADHRNKTITLVNPDNAGADHFTRVYDKYSDFTPCPATRKRFKKQIAAVDKRTADVKRNFSPLGGWMS